MPLLTIAPPPPKEKEHVFPLHDPFPNVVPNVVPNVFPKKKEHLFPASRPPLPKDKKRFREWPSRALLLENNNKTDPKAPDTAPLPVPVETSQPHSWSKGTGRRKSSIARVQVKNGTGQMKINFLSGGEYMQNNDYLMQKIQAPLVFLQLETKVDIVVKVNGGGLVGQAYAIQLGIARALCHFKPEYRPSLKLKGLLTRDARVKERKKYGLKKARKAPQYSKR